MRALALLLIATVFALAACAPVAETVEWHGRALREVRALADLPAPVRTGLGVERPAIEAIADRGRPFNVTDRVDTRLPMRRLLFAGISDDSTLVFVEHGGRGYRIDVSLFAVQDPVPVRTWVLLERPRGLRDAVAMLAP